MQVIEPTPESRPELGGDQTPDTVAFLQNEEDENDEEECEMILGDIPDVSIPPVLQNYAALLKASSKAAGGSSKSKQTTPQKGRN